MRIGPFSVNRWKISRLFLRAAASLPERSHERTKKRVVVLCHHSVHPHRWIASATPALFEDHLAWLATECTCVRFQDIPQHVGAGDSGKPVVAITFDDGYDDNHEYALPLLEKWQIPATFFITPGLIEGDPPVIERFRKLMHSEYDDFHPMSWSQIAELRDAGMEVGAHTYSHPNLALVPSSRVAWELSHSKEIIEQRIGETVTSMAYPFGKPKRHVTQEVVDLAAAAGYRQAGLILHRAVKRKDSLLALPRFNTVQDSVDEIRARVWGYLDVVGAAQTRAPEWMERLVSPEDFLFGPG